MTESDIYNALSEIIEEKESEFEEDIIITRESRYITIPKFLDKFGESDLNLSSLESNTSTDDEWLNIFQKWNNDGILPS